MARRKKKAEVEVVQEPEKALDTAQDKEIVVGSNVRLTGLGRKTFDKECNDDYKNVPGIVKTILTTKEYGYGVFVEPIQDIRWFRKEDIGFFD